MLDNDSKLNTALNHDFHQVTNRWLEIQSCIPKATFLPQPHYWFTDNGVKLNSAPIDSFSSAVRERFLWESTGGPIMAKKSFQQKVACKSI